MAHEWVTNDIVAAIRQGRLDTGLEDLAVAVRDRRLARQAKLTEQVRAEFGEDAYIGGTGPNNTPSGLVV